MGRTKANDGWEDIDGTETGIAFSESKRDYVTSDGKHAVEAGMDFNTGKIDELKSKLGTFAKDEVKKMGYSHKWKVQKQISSEPGQKSCRVRVVEQDGLDGPDTQSTQTTGANSPEDPADLTPLQVLKNFVDEIAKDVRQLRTWVFVVGGIALVAFVLAGLKWLV